MRIWKLLQRLADNLHESSHFCSKVNLVLNQKEEGVFLPLFLCSELQKRDWTKGTFCSVKRNRNPSYIFYFHLHVNLQPSWHLFFHRWCHHDMFGLRGNFSEALEAHCAVGGSFWRFSILTEEKTSRGNRKCSRANRFDYICSPEFVQIPCIGKYWSLPQYRWNRHSDCLLKPLPKSLHLHLPMVRVAILPAES